MEARAFLAEREKEKRWMKERSVGEMAAPGKLCGCAAVLVRNASDYPVAYLGADLAEAHGHARKVAGLRAEVRHAQSAAGHDKDARPFSALRTREPAAAAAGTRRACSGCCMAAACRRPASRRSGAPAKRIASETPSTSYCRRACGSLSRRPSAAGRGRRPRAPRAWQDLSAPFLGCRPRGGPLAVSTSSSGSGGGSAGAKPVSPLSSTRRARSCA